MSVWFRERVMFLGFVLSSWEVEAVACRENSRVWVFSSLCESLSFWKEKGVKKERKSVSEGDLQCLFCVASVCISFMCFRKSL